MVPHVVPDYKTEGYGGLLNESPSQRMKVGLHPWAHPWLDEPPPAPFPRDFRTGDPTQTRSSFPSQRTMARPLSRHHIAGTPGWTYVLAWLHPRTRTERFRVLSFEWDSLKASSNERKHGVSFPEAATAVGDPLSITIPDPEHSIGEARFVLLRLSYQGRLVVVAHAEAGDSIRLISAPFGHASRGQIL